MGLRASRSGCVLDDCRMSVCPNPPPPPHTRGRARAAVGDTAVGDTAVGRGSGFGLCAARRPASNRRASGQTSPPCPRDQLQVFNCFSCPYLFMVLREQPSGVGPDPPCAALPQRACCHAESALSRAVARRTVKDSDTRRYGHRDTRADGAVTLRACRHERAVARCHGDCTALGVGQNASPRSAASESVLSR